MNSTPSKKIRISFCIFPVLRTLLSSRQLSRSVTASDEYCADLGMATKAHWRGRPAVVGLVLLRLVKGLCSHGIYWAPNAECTLPILCASLSYSARTKATESAEIARRLRRIA